MSIVGSIPSADLPDEAMRETRTRIVAGPHPRRFVSGAMVSFGESFGGTVFDSLAWAVRDMRERRRLGELIRAAGPSIPIARAEDGIVRIEGRVDVLWAPLPQHPEIGAYLLQRSWDGSCGCAPECQAVRRTVVFYEDAGQLTVEDDSEVALVVGSHVHLVDYHGRRPDPFGPGALEAQRGDVITLIGPATRKSVEGAPRQVATKSGYRQTRFPLVFEGTKANPVHLFVPPGSD